MTVCGMKHSTLTGIRGGVFQYASTLTVGHYIVFVSAVVDNSLVTAFLQLLVFFIYRDIPTA